MPTETTVDIENPTYHLEQALGRAIRGQRWELARMILAALEADALEQVVRGEGRKAWERARRQPPTPPGAPLGAGLCQHGARADGCPLEHEQKDVPPPINAEPTASPYRRSCHCGGVGGGHAPGIYGCITSTQFVDPQ